MENKDKTKLFLKYSQKNDLYSDGDIENTILEGYQKKGSSIEKDFKNRKEWPLIYHFSPIRENLLSWFPFKKDSNLLEVGAGCGAITRLFTEKLKNVTAIELSTLRAKIIKYRYPDKNNLKIYAGNLNDIKIKSRFDYVTLIGVLEYAGKYTHTKNPFLDFLLSIKKYLAADGTLIIAIENKFGLKYWSGCKEDHTGRLFDSIENYPNKIGIETFGKNEITKLIKKAGFSEISFYYPLPDYKMPTEIFSDDYLPTLNHNIKPDIFPFKDNSQERYQLFNEKLAMDNIINNNNFDFFANSFLIFAKIGK